MLYIFLFLQFTYIFLCFCEIFIELMLMRISMNGLLYTNVVSYACPRAILSKSQKGQKIGYTLYMRNALFISSIISVWPCNTRNCRSILCLGVCLRLVDFLTNLKEKKILRQTIGLTCRITYFLPIGGHATACKWDISRHSFGHEDWVGR